MNKVYDSSVIITSLLLRMPPSSSDFLCKLVSKSVDGALTSSLIWSLEPPEYRLKSLISLRELKMHLQQFLDLYSVIIITWCGLHWIWMIKPKKSEWDKSNYMSFMVGLGSIRQHKFFSQNGPLGEFWTTTGLWEAQIRVVTSQKNTHACFDLLPCIFFFFGNPQVQID